MHLRVRANCFGGTCMHCTNGVQLAQSAFPAAFAVGQRQSLHRAVGEGQATPQQCRILRYRNLHHRRLRRLRIASGELLGAEGCFGTEDGGADTLVLVTGHLLHVWQQETNNHKTLHLTRFRTSREGLTTCTSS